MNNHQSIHVQNLDATVVGGLRPTDLQYSRRFTVQTDYGVLSSYIQSSQGYSLYVLG